MIYITIIIYVLLQLQAGARSVQRTIRNNFMDNTKQEAIDMLLFNNAFSGELGQKARSFLERADAFGKAEYYKNNMIMLNIDGISQILFPLLLLFHSHS